MNDFAIYIDDSGSPKPNREDSAPFFAMGGVLIDRSDLQKIEDEVSSFKDRWQISLDVPLHGSPIRSKKKAFSWLGKLTENELEQFHCDLGETITRCPIVVTACVISRVGYCNRYLDRYGPKTWEMMKTAFTILLERTAKFVARHDGRLMVYYEKMGRREDRILEGYFRDFRDHGSPFDPTNSAKYLPLSCDDLKKRLEGIEGKTKKGAAMQISDLCLYPIVNSLHQPSNRALKRMRDARVIIDDLLKAEEIATHGVKYFCFDEATKNRQEGG
jgi:hypothetical protein